MHPFFRSLAAVVGLGLVVAAVPGRAAEKTDPETVNKLIDKLSSGRFAERVKAQKGLEEIGLPALDALKKAAEYGDPETKRRAAEMVEKLERQVTGAKVLAPTRVKLQLKDVSVPDALAELKKQSGYAVVLHDPEGKLKERKVTLDTGDVVFWEALDKLCEKAGLVEAEAHELQFPGGIQPGFQPGGIQIQPGIIQPLPALPPGNIQIQPIQINRIQLQPINRNVLPVVPEKVLPPQRKEDAAPAKPALRNALRADADTAPAQVKPAVKPVVRPVVKPVVVPVPAVGRPVPAVQPVQIQPVLRRPVVRPRPWRPGMVPPGGNQQIVLKEGKPDAAPTAYAGAVRVKVIDNVQLFGAAPNGEITVGLKVSPEPKLRWQQLVAVRIDKAIDDKGQELMPSMNGSLPGGGAAHVGYGGVHQYVPVRLSKGDKETQELKELTGILTATVLAAPETYITVEDVTKAAGKTAKGKDGGAIKVGGYEERNGQIVIRAEVDAPANVVPAAPNMGGADMPIGFDVLPALPVAPPAPVPLPALPPGAFQVQAAQPVQIQVQVGGGPVQVQQIQVGNGRVVRLGGGGFAGGGFAGNHGGLELLDTDGKSIPCVGSGMMGRANAGGPVQFEHQMTFQPQKGQTPAKLVFRGSKSVSVEVPFSFKNVKVN